MNNWIIEAEKKKKKIFQINLVKIATVIKLYNRLLRNLKCSETVILVTSFISNSNKLKHTRKGFL